MNADELIKEYNSLSQFDKEYFLAEIIRAKGGDKIIEFIVHQIGADKIIGILDDYVY